MCGISGVFLPGGGHVDLGSLLNMTRTLEHRGPDEEGYFVNGEATRHTPAEAPLLALLTAEPVLSSETLIVHCNSVAAQEIVMALLEGGHLYWLS